MIGPSELLRSTDGAWISLHPKGFPPQIQAPWAEQQLPLPPASAGKETSAQGAWTRLLPFVPANRVQKSMGRRMRGSPDQPPGARVVYFSSQVLVMGVWQFRRLQNRAGLVRFLALALFIYAVLSLLFSGASLPSEGAGLDSSGRYAQHWSARLVSRGGQDGVAGSRASALEGRVLKSGWSWEQGNAISNKSVGSTQGANLTEQHAKDKQAEVGPIGSLSGLWPGKSESRTLADTLAALASGDIDAKQLELEGGNEPGFERVYENASEDSQPEIVSVDPSHGPRAGGYAILLRGRLFGDNASQLLVTIGGTPCLGTRWLSPEAVHCLVPPGRGVGLPVAILPCSCRTSDTLTTNPNRLLEQQLALSNPGGLSFSYDEDAVKDVLKEVDLRGWRGLPVQLHKAALVTGSHEVAFCEATTGQAETYSISPAMAAALPAVDWETQYERCAVVGHSGSLQHSGLGALIDGHEAIFRYDNAPTSKHFVRDAGTRTAFQVLDHRWLQVLMGATAAGLEVAKVERWWSDVATLVVWSPLSQELYVQLRTMFPNSSVMYLSPELVSAVTADVAEIHRRVQAVLNPRGTVTTGGHLAGVPAEAVVGVASNSGTAPTSLFYTLGLALRLCNQVTVYGAYGPCSSDKRACKWRYYDEREPNEAEQLRTRAEEALLVALERAGYVNITAFGKTEGEPLALVEGARVGIDEREQGPGLGELGIAKEESEANAQNVKESVEDLGAKIEGGEEGGGSQEVAEGAVEREGGVGLDRRRAAAASEFAWNRKVRAQAAQAILERSTRQLLSTRPTITTDSLESLKGRALLEEREGDELEPLREALKQCEEKACKPSCSGHGIFVNGSCLCEGLHIGANCEDSRVREHARPLLAKLPLSWHGALRMHQGDVELSPEGQHVMVLPPGSSGNHTFDGDVYHVGSQVFELLPRKDVQLHYGSCAVVGNSGAMLLRKYGSQIDSHDMVWRFNQAPLQGFTEHVGQRTTFEMLNSAWIKNLLEGDDVAVGNFANNGAGPQSWGGFGGAGLDSDPHGPPGWIWRRPDTPLVLFELYDPASHPYRNAFQIDAKMKWWKAMYVKLRTLYPDRAVHVLSPRFVAWAYASHKALRDRAEEAGLGSFTGEKPMSGFYAILYLLQICDRIDMYGFTPYRDEDRLDPLGIPYHYFDKARPRVNSHSFDLTRYFYEFLHGALGSKFRIYD